jgi:hypothetical protein
MNPGASASLSSSTTGIEDGPNDGRTRPTDSQNLIFMEMEQYPASRAPHARDSRQRSDAPRSPMETPREQAAVSWRWMDPCRGWSRDLSICGSHRRRCRLGPALHAHLQWTLCHKPQPYVFGFDFALSRSCSHHAKHVDGRITSSCGSTHPPGRPAGRAHAGGSVRGRIHQVPEAGSSIRLVAGVVRRLSDTPHATFVEFPSTHSRYKGR